MTYLLLVLEHSWLPWIILSLFSLCIGSFLNVVIYRLPIMLRYQWEEHCAELNQTTIPSHPPMNLFLPRSHCTHCKKIIPWYRNIPIISFFLAKGRCFFCHAKISSQYPLVELITMILGWILAALIGFNLTFLWMFLLTCLLIPIAVIDLKYQIIPDSLNYFIIWSGLLSNIGGTFVSIEQAVIGAVVGYLCLYLFIHTYALLTGKFGMGHGDFKLFAGFGAWFGALALPYILVLASFIGAISGLIYLSINQKHKDTPIPFAPFLCFSGWGVGLFLSVKHFIPVIG